VIPFFESVPDFNLRSGDTASLNIIIEGRQCKTHLKAASSTQALEWIAVDDQNVICAALLRNGIQFTFTNVVTPPTFTDSELDDSLLCNAQCNDQMDIYFIGDESGSVTLAGFNSEIAFAKSVINALNIKNGSVHAGLCFFSDDATLVQELTSDKARLISALDAKPYQQGKTCISCGITLASVNFESSKSRPGIPKLYIVISDGKNNKPEPQSVADLRLTESITRAHQLALSNGGAVVAIGVGSDYNKTEMSRIATKPKFVLQVSGFDTLKGIVNDVISSSCDESDYICDSCSEGFCLCGKCQGCPNGCPGEFGNEDTPNIDNALSDNNVNVPLLVGLLVAALVVIAIAIVVIIFVVRKRKQDEQAETEEGRQTIDVGDRSERYSGLVRKFSVNQDDVKRVTKD
jgi:Mg-chelatase subunit ChlD/preprotein translocase subunit YajC